jgi:citrate lyase beta subunit
MERAPESRRTWLSGAGADTAMHEAMARCGADVLIHDLEDSTPPERRAQARALAPRLYQGWREAGVLHQLGEERVLVDGVWIELPTYLNARRLVQTA